MGGRQDKTQNDCSTHVPGTGGLLALLDCTQVVYTPKSLLGMQTTQTKALKHSTEDFFSTILFYA